MIAGQPERRLRYVDALDPNFEGVPQGEGRRALASVTEGERLYRLMFLTSLQLIAEQPDTDGLCFSLMEDIAVHL